MGESREMNGENIAVILAGGIGQRYGNSVPKQYTLLAGKEVISYTIDTCRKSEKIDSFLVVLDKEEFQSGEIEEKYHIKTVCGGNTRNRSFRNAVDYIAEHYPKCKRVVLLEAARPLTKVEWIDDYFKLLEEYAYVETCLAIHDALGGVRERIPDRNDFYLIQSPEAYQFDVIYKYFSRDSEIQHAAQQLPESVSGYRYYIPRSNFKVTVPEDADLIEYLLQKEKGEK